MGAITKTLSTSVVPSTAPPSVLVSLHLLWDMECQGSEHLSFILATQHPKDPVILGESPVMSLYLPL